MRIQIKYFAAIREAVGRAEETADLPAAIRTVADVRHWLRERGGAWAEALAADRAVRCALDLRITDPASPIADGCEVAFFPPVTGG